MALTAELPIWLAPGIKPGTELYTNGWGDKEYPSAEVFNFLQNRAYLALKELQEQMPDNINISILESKAVTDLPKSYPIAKSVMFIFTSDTVSADWLTALSLTGSYYLIVETTKTTLGNGVQRVSAYLNSTSATPRIFERSANNSGYGTFTEFAVKADVVNKVDKIEGKGLSTNDYTNAEKTKLAGIATGATNTTVEDGVTSTSKTNAASANSIKTVNDALTAHKNDATQHVSTLAAKAVTDLPNTYPIGKSAMFVSTSDTVSADWLTALNLNAVYLMVETTKTTSGNGVQRVSAYTLSASTVPRTFVRTAGNSGWSSFVENVNAENGKGLSTNDFTNAEKTKLAGIATGANNTTVLDSVTSTSTTSAASAASVKKAYDLASASSHYVDDTKTLSSAASTFNVGTTITQATSLQSAFNMVVAEILGFGISSTDDYFLYKLVTQKTAKSTTQKIEIYANILTVGPVGALMFELNRVTNSVGTWQAWQATRHIISFKGNPEGSLLAYAGTLVYDVINANLYKKRIAANIITNTDWVLIG